MKWCEEIDLNSPGRAASKNKLSGFLGGIGNRRWEIYQPGAGENADRALNLRPIGDDEIRFDVHQYGDLDFVKISKLNKEELSWSLFEVELDNQPSIFVGSVPAWQLELVSSVPSLESEISRYESAKRILDNHRAEGRWQRQIVKKNRESIALFFDNEEAFFANPVILHDSGSDSVHYETNDDGVAKVRLTLGFFRDKRSIKLVDEEAIDSRPLTIIDGQHRIRGAALAPNKYDQRLMVVILPPGISEATAGKIFAQINTLSQPLKDKHNMFLAHRFQVSSPNPRFTFGAFDRSS